MTEKKKANKSCSGIHNEYNNNIFKIRLIHLLEKAIHKITM